MPGIRVRPIDIANETTVAADIEAGASGAIGDIVAALTAPLTAGERSPTRDAAAPPRIAFAGDYEAVNRFFYRRGWTDGLPVVPPTEKAVAEMLLGTDLPPDHVVARVIPRLGKATVEKIAVNAVMAGALPTHMPVLLAAVRALMNPKSRFDTFEVSTGSWAPFFALNGPVRNDILVNSGSGALSPGDIANAAIGRAVGLIVKNIGGARKGIEDMGVLGNPSKYSLVIGENEEESPWTPLHVDRGFEKEDSTLTLFFPNGFAQSVPRATSAEGIARALADMGPWSMSCLVVIPSHARILAAEGWTKEKLQEYILRNAADPFAAIGAKPDVLSAPPPLNRGGLLILVAGGPGAWMGMLRSVGGIENDFVTERIEFPKNWDSLVKKYKNVKPTYEDY